MAVFNARVRYAKSVRKQTSQHPLKRRDIRMRVVARCRTKRRLAHSCVGLLIRKNGVQLISDVQNLRKLCGLFSAEVNRVTETDNAQTYSMSPSDIRQMCSTRASMSRISIEPNARFMRPLSLMPSSTCSCNPKSMSVFEPTSLIRFSIIALALCATVCAIASSPACAIVVRNRMLIA